MTIALTSAMIYIEGVHDKCTTICVAIIGITAVSSGHEKKQSRTKIRILEAHAYLINRDEVSGKVNFSIKYREERRSFRAVMSREDLCLCRCSGLCGCAESSSAQLPISYLIISEDHTEDDRCPIGFATMIYHDSESSPFDGGVCFSRIPKRIADLDWSDIPEYPIYDSPTFDVTMPIEKMQRISEHGIMFPDNFAAFSEEDAVLARLIA